jgi:hypothetical protein
MFINLTNIKPVPPLTEGELRDKVHEFLKTLHRDHYDVVVERIGFESDDEVPK